MCSFRIIFLNLVLIKNFIYGCSCALDEEALTENFKKLITKDNICDYKSLRYNKYNNTAPPIVPPPLPKDKFEENSIIQCRECIKIFRKKNSDKYNEAKFKKIYDCLLKGITTAMVNFFTITDDDKNNIVLECPFKIPEIIDEEDIDNIFNISNVDEKILKIIQKYFLLGSDHMVYTYLQKDIINDADIRKNGYKKLPEGFKPKDYENKILLAIINLKSKKIVFLEENN